jgi:hypothetical protein
VSDYHVRQMTGSACGPYNCAASSGAMAVAFGSAGKHQPTSDEFRAKSGASCVPGVDTPSGGLNIVHVEQTAAKYGVTVDYGRDGGGLRRWTSLELRDWCTDDGAVVLGDYDQIPASIDAQPGFAGDHSVWVHDYRASDDTACWHDPLARGPIRVKWSIVAKYNQKAGSPVKGLAGFVRIPEVAVRNFTLLYDAAGRVIPATLTFPDAAAKVLILATDKLIPVKTTWIKQGIKARLKDSIIAGKPRTDEWMLGWLIGDDAAFALDRNVKATPYTAARSYPVTVAGKAVGTVTLP